MLRKILLCLLLTFIVVVVGLVVIVAMQPSEFHITRSTTISAQPAAVFEEVNDFHKWDAWSPWAKLDPNAENTFEGPESGTGAIFRWSGNDDVGEGSMKITESRPNDRIQIEIGFTRPMQDTSDVEFMFEPDGDQTTVTWSMSGEHNFVSKAFCLVMDMDEMIGGKYEEGLAKLKSIVESKHQQ